MSYLPIDGSQAYAAAVQRLMFGEGHEVETSGRAATSQTPGGLERRRRPGGPDRRRDRRRRRRAEPALALLAVRTGLACQDADDLLGPDLRL